MIMREDLLAEDIFTPNKSINHEGLKNFSQGFILYLMVTCEHHGHVSLAFLVQSHKAFLHKQGRLNNIRTHMKL